MTTHHNRPVPVRMHRDEVEVTEALVRELIATQMPQLSSRPLTSVEPWGTDNAIWRLGDDLAVRLPRIHWAADQIEREQSFLHRLRGRLPVDVPGIVQVGGPGAGYPFRWGVYRWVPGHGAALDLIADPSQFAHDLAVLVRALQQVPADGAPPARNRARPLCEYDHSTRRAIDVACHLIDADAARRVWEDACAAPAYDGAPVWVHGDLEGNCLVRDGRLSGLVDWGSACAGDPAVDVQVVWSPLFTDASRAVFLDLLGVDDATIRRSRGAAINQACAALPYYLRTYPLIVERSWHKLAAMGVERSA
jgi:aminoglycoside phosphotransferase (APT) family kinase protein